MDEEKAFYFVTHSRIDHNRIEPILDALTRQGLPIWVDTMVQPGRDWEKTIADALNHARGILFFVSRGILLTPLVKRQVDILSESRMQFVVTILLDGHIPLPPKFKSAATVDIGANSPDEAAQKILAAVETLPDAPMQMDAQETERIAHLLAEKNRGTKFASQPSKAHPDSIFIVHGHDLELRNEVDDYLRSLHIKTIILSEIDASQQETLIQKFLSFSEDVEFAVVLLSADDYGAARRQYDVDGVADRALQFRARQNVVLELGFFYGYLGWEKVFVMYKPPDKPFPNFETPSDLGGILFDEVDAAGEWKKRLANRLREAGFVFEDE